MWAGQQLDPESYAVTSTVSADSNRRGQALQLIRGRLYTAAQQRAASVAR